MILNSVLKLPVRLLSAAAICVVAIAGSTAYAESESTLSVSLFTPPSSDLNRLFREINEALTEETGGKLQLELFEASQMGPAPRQFDLVRQGVADISVHLLGLTPGRFPKMELLDMAGVIDSGTSADVAAPVSAAVLDLAQSHLSDELDGVRLLNVTVLPNPIVLTVEEITSLDQLENSRIRHPGPAHSRTLEALGAVPTFVPSTEMSEALARGNVEGVLTGFAGLRSFHLLDSAKYVIELASGGMTFVVVMNREAYDGLPDELQLAFDKHFGPEGQAEWGRLLAQGEVDARSQMIEAGAIVRGLSEADAAKFASVSVELRERAAAQLDADGLDGTGFLEALMAASEAYR